jgi:hypothetical protein
MLVVEKKKHDETNMYYGVDLNDKKAVEKEFRRRNNIHRLVTLVAILLILALGVVFADFCRVNYMGGRPVFAKYSKVKNGTLFEGLGYSVLYCTNGERYVGAVLYNDCESIDPDSNSFKEVLARSIRLYAEGAKLSKKGSIDEIIIHEFYADEELSIDNETIEDKIKKDAEKKTSLINPNPEKTKDKDDVLLYYDYYVDFEVKCKKGDNCLNLEKDFEDPSHLKVIVRFDWFNDIVQILYSKTTGEHAKIMGAEYSEKVKNYFVSDGKATEDNIKSIEITFLDTKGKGKFRGTSYAESYLIRVDYRCLDDGNACITPYDKEDEEGDFSNLSFRASMFLDGEGNIISMGPKEYFDL